MVAVEPACGAQGRRARCELGARGIQRHGIARRGLDVRVVGPERFASRRSSWWRCPRWRDARFGAWAKRGPPLPRRLHLARRLPSPLGAASRTNSPAGWTVYYAPHCSIALPPEWRVEPIWMRKDPRPEWWRMRYMLYALCATERGSRRSGGVGRPLSGAGP